ncbi:hypothetical protein RJ640_013248 [Escallonia rubra]|uniref:Pectate lyase domain-containing protein n=1 Tax=Escallonia rubra TaxID=112253 RepID=A0AA88R6U2_9ASTE|nr:hypothetical protein RJ640_013248 [Escallonia rubra]
MASLPYADVDSSLRSLAGRAEGFGRFAVGGLHGPLYRVTTLAVNHRNAHIKTMRMKPTVSKGFIQDDGVCLSDISMAWSDHVASFPPLHIMIHSLSKHLLVDDGPGSLRDGCRRKEPLWVVFEVSGTIHLSSYLSVSSYKTIDGRGQRIKLTGKGLRLKDCEHIIICNLEFEGGRGHDVDGIQIKPNSRHIWIDRCSLSDYDDGLIDITRQSTDITVSRCYFTRHDKTMLIGADPSHIGDRCIRVTIHHCFFDGTRQRQPRLRFGKVHLYNNYTRNWGIYAVCASVEAQIYSQCNIYEAGQKKKTFEYYTEKPNDTSQFLPPDHLVMLGSPEWLKGGRVGEDKIKAEVIEIEVVEVRTIKALRGFNAKAMLATAVIAVTSRVEKENKRRVAVATIGKTVMSGAAAVWFGCYFDVVFEELIAEGERYMYLTELASDKEGASSGLIRSEGDIFLNGAQACLLTGTSEECLFHPSEFYPTWTLESASDSLKNILQVCSGWQSIPRPAEQSGASTAPI